MLSFTFRKKLVQFILHEKKGHSPDFQCDLAGNWTIYQLSVLLLKDFPALFSEYVLTGTERPSGTKIKSHSRLFRSTHVGKINRSPKNKIIKNTLWDGVINYPQSGIAGTPDISNIECGGDSLQAATTQFVDNEDVEKCDSSHADHVNNSWLEINDTQATEQNILDFLRKPIVLTKGSFATTDPFPPAAYFNLPYVALSNVMWRQKWAGYYGIRMDMRFKLVVNANRFQQGRYIVGWVPLGGSNGTSHRNIETVNMRLATLVQRTTVPHVEIDLATQTSCELLVPFASVNNFYPLENVTQSTAFANVLGYLSIYPYSPLVTVAGSNTASYTLYVSFENVKLFGASNAQSGLSEKEVSNKMDGPISGVAKNFAKGFTEFSKIPLLSSYALSAAWISDRISKTASVFGYCKPTQGDSMSKMIMLNNPGHSNTDGDSVSRALSFFARPSTLNMKGQSSVTYDEMDFSFVMRKYAWFSFYQWPTSFTADDGIANISLKPSTFSNTVSSAVHFTPMAFVSGFFNYWRGSIRFKFKLVKTEFHSGRIAFAFFPGTTADFTKPEFVNRLIVDIRETTEIELLVPYISKYPYLNFNELMGTLRIYVVDPLIAPDTVSPNITILAEVAAGDDFELAMPGAFDYTPARFVPQSGLMEDNKRLSVNIGNSKIDYDPIAASSFCIGDKISSFRTLLKRYCKLSLRDLSVAEVGFNGIQLVIQQDLFPTGQYVALSPSVNADNLAIVGMCYAFFGGGVRIKDIVNFSLFDGKTAIPTSNNIVATLNPTDGGGTVASFVTSYSSPIGAPAFNFHQVFQQSNVNNSIELEIPQYTRNIVRCVADIWSTQYAADTELLYLKSGGSQAFLNLALPAGLGPVTKVAGFNVHNLYRSMADDGNLSLFISVPPMTSTPSVSAYGLY